MKKNMKKDPNCSIYPDPFPCCVWKEICNAYERIKRTSRKHKKYGKLFKRSWEMSQPIRRREKFMPKQYVKPRRVINIVRPLKTISTRLQQLSLPRLRRLLIVKKKYFRRFDTHHKQEVNRLVRRNLFSLYARLGNVIPPKLKKKPYKWQAEDWENFNQRLKRLAKPKKTAKPKSAHKRPTKKYLEDFSIFDKLAVPNIKEKEEPYEWVFKKSMLKPAGWRLNKLALPFIRNPPAYKDPIKVKPGALIYKATERVKLLAEPKIKDSQISDLKTNPFEISPNALKYKPTARILDLAEPKQYAEKYAREFKVSRKALQYKATARIIQLSQPKVKLSER